MGAFDLLHDAEDASGDEAVAKVVRVKAAAAAEEAKAKAEEAKAKAEEAKARKEEARKAAEERGEVWVDDEPEAPKEQPKERKKKGTGPKKGQQAPPKEQPQQQQPDGEADESPRGSNARGAGRGRGQAIVGGSGGGFQGGRGNVRVLLDSNGNRIFENAGDRSYNRGNNTVNGAGYGYNNGNRGYNNGPRRFNNGYSNANGGEVNNENNGQYQQAYNENNGHYQRDGHSNNNYGQRQGYRRDDGQTRRQNLQYVPKSKPSSEAASDADQKSEGKVEEPAAEAPQKEAIAENVDAAPASESEKSAGDVAKDETKKVDGEGGEPKAKKQKDPNFKRLSGSQRRKLKNKNLKKDDSNDVEASKNTTENVPEVIEEEKQEMTLEEYEKKLGKKKASEPSKSEERMVALEAFEGFKLLEKKKMEDDDRLKQENGQRKAREAAAKEGKARKLSIQEYLKPADGQEYVPPRRDGPASGGRGNGGYGGRSRDNRTESRIYNSSNGNNPIVFHAVDASNGNGVPRRDGSRERRDGGYQQGGYNGGRGNGGYQQGGYNGGRGNGSYQQGGYNGGRGNGVYQERRDSYNGERREGGYNGGNQVRREVGNQQGGGFQERRQGGYQQGGYRDGRGNGGYQQGGGRGYYGGRGYGGRGGYRREPEVPQPDSAVDFPALGAAAPAPAQAIAPSPSQSQA